jgi:hypothetical protein
VPYFHVVYTLLAPIADIASGNLIYLASTVSAFRSHERAKSEAG